MRQLAQQGQNSALTLFTQEVPNARFQHYEDQIHALTDEIDKRDALIADKDSLLETQETERRFNDIGDAPHNSLNTRSTVKTLRSDLTAEIKHNKDINAQLKVLRATPMTP